MVLGDLYEEVVLPCRGVMTHMVELLHWMETDQDQGFFRMTHCCLLSSSRPCAFKPRGHRHVTSQSKVGAHVWSSAVVQNA